jgi:2-polyprenyl-6-methoxyphenol hydroxylase-like FAD-dependent oxidoreductase
MVILADVGGGIVLTVLVAGGGIAGLSVALTCHQIGVPVRVFESVSTLRPLGVGINLQPNAVRELLELGFAAELEAIGVAAEEWALFARNGREVWSEPRGTLAGYRWPQYSVHRGKLQMALYAAVLERLGRDAVVTGARLASYETGPSAVTATFKCADGSVRRETGEILIGADGIRSTVRAQMHPSEGAPIWNGAVMWRGVSQHPPVRTRNSFVLIGTMAHRFVCYPISKADPATGLATMNWIAERTLQDKSAWGDSDWDRRATFDEFLPYFLDWDFGWLDAPRIMRGASEVFVYPMVDRDPVDHWTDGRVLLLGDAAHAMYPTGSNGASQAIVDARILGAKLLDHGLGEAALLAYETDLRDNINALILRNRGAGPIGLLGVVEQRCAGEFENIDDVVPRAEAEEFMAKYKRAAGFAKEALNNSAPLIDPRRYRVSFT